VEAHQPVNMCNARERSVDRALQMNAILSMAGDFDKCPEQRTRAANFNV
jgi:hypothetical protein